MALPTNRAVNLGACTTGLLLMAFAFFSLDFLWSILVPQEPSRLGGVVVSVLVTGPKVAGSNPAKTMDF
jgi:hypothetical protein